VVKVNVTFIADFVTAEIIIVVGTHGRFPFRKGGAGPSSAAGELHPSQDLAVSTDSSNSNLGIRDKEAVNFKGKSQDHGRFPFGAEPFDASQYIIAAVSEVNSHLHLS
jgi:hypothetical protein